MSLCSPAMDIAQYLEDDGRGTIGTNIFVSREPDQPNAVTTLFDTGSWREGDAKNELDSPLVQIRVRGAKESFPALWQRVERIVKAMNVMANDPQEINGNRYGGCWLQSGPFLIGYDENSRPIVSINFRLLRSIDR